MILLPIGRDDAEIRRHAWISYVILALNILAFVAVETATRSSKMVALEMQFGEAIDYLASHPYLEVPADMAPLINEAGMQELQRRRDAIPENALPAPEVIEQEQATLDEMTAKVFAVVNKLPHMQYGYIPANGGFLTLVTSMFVHAGFFHLLGNLIFFFVSGPFVEDVFGRPVFMLLYVTGGFAASLTYALRHPDGTTPLVGASGAIAAVMGAYLVRFFRSKVEFLFIPVWFRPQWHYRFFAPAFIVLPLWFVQQWLEMQSEASGGGVAFSAHVGGFVYGFGFALLVKAIRFEEKHVNPVVEQETTWAMDERTLKAMAALRDAEVIEDYAAIDAAAAQLLARYVDDGQIELATDLIHENQARPLPKFLSRAAMFAERQRDRDLALTLYQRLFDSDPNGGTAVQSLVKIGTLLRSTGDVAGARESYEKARAHPACAAEWAPAIEAKISALATSAAAAGASAKGA